MTDVHWTSAPTRAQLYAVFSAYDDERRGFIDLEEVQEALTKAGKQVSPTDVRKILEQVHANADDGWRAGFIRMLESKPDGTLSWEEFEAAFQLAPDTPPMDVGSLLFRGFGAVAELSVGALSAVGSSSAAVGSGVASAFRPSEATLRALFAAFDTDESGFIDAAELHAALEKGGKRVSEEETRAILEQLDTNSDGKISLEEFKAVFAIAPDALPPGVKQLVDGSAMMVHVMAYGGKRLSDTMRFGYVPSTEPRVMSESGGRTLFSFSAGSPFAKDSGPPKVPDSRWHLNLDSSG